MFGKEVNDIIMDNFFLMRDLNIFYVSFSIGVDDIVYFLRRCLIDVWFLCVKIVSTEFIWIHLLRVFIGDGSEHADGKRVVVASATDFFCSPKSTL